MAGGDQQSLNQDAIKALYRIISKERMGPYLVAAGYDDTRAFRLYLWNARVGEAFHIPIQAVEVGLRNSVNYGLIEAFGDKWWGAEGFLKVIDRDRADDLNTVLRRIKNRKLSLDTGQIVAGLSFGFWVGMLQARYNPNIWSRYLRVAFPHFPTNRSRRSLAGDAGRIASLRNRISHHEPLILRDISKDYQTVMQMVEWLCPTKLEWIKPACRVPEILRQKP